MGPYQWLNCDVIVMYSDVWELYQRPSSDVVVMYSDAIGPYQRPISFMY